MAKLIRDVDLDKYNHDDEHFVKIKKKKQKFKDEEKPNKSKNK